MAPRRSRASWSAGRDPLDRLADVRDWPHEPSIAHLVLLDVERTPTVEQIDALADETFAARPEVTTIRTSALFPGPREHFAAAGFEICDRLALLERAIDRVEPIRTMRRRSRGATITDLRLRRLGGRQLSDAERIDRAAFPAGWANSARSLGDIATATPRHRARLATSTHDVVGFAITGVAGPTGYLQRLAVDPRRQRGGVGRLLVDDALAWLQRKGATTALVNTGVDNEPALELYRSLGFRHRRDELVVMHLDRS